MDLEGIMLSKMSECKRQILYAITSVWHLKKYNKLVSKTKKRRTHRHREQTVTSGEVGRGAIGVNEREIQSIECKIGYKGILNSSGNIASIL